MTGAMWSESGATLIGVIVSLLTGVQCFIIPDEVPSLLSLVYSNIPPVKKGTDSRLGLGFRLGPHADFQVLLELGPQTHTGPIGGNEPESPSKRDTLVISNPFAIVDIFKNVQGEPTTEAEPVKNQEPTKKDKISNTEGGKWIKWWKKNVLGSGPIEKIKFDKVPGIDEAKRKSSQNDLHRLRDSSRPGKGIMDQLKSLYVSQKTP